MAKFTIKIIHEKALEIIALHPDGIRFSQLRDRIKEELPGVNEGTLYAQIPDLPKKYPNKVKKPSWGVYGPAIRDDQEEVCETDEASYSDFSEADFYRPFADYLVNELEECKEAEVLGGSVTRRKWFTPDVIGTNKHNLGMRIHFPTEIISVEIKTNPHEAITGFGQAVSYKLFSNKSYLVLSREAFKDERKRIIALCMMEGIGLVEFDENNNDISTFNTLLRARRFQPDIEFANDVADKLCTIANLKSLFLSAWHF